MIQKLELEVKETIEKLIKTATNFDVETLNSIYHNNLQVIMINNLGEKMISSKQMFIDLFKTKRDNKDVPLNTWSEFHHIEAKGHSAHVILSRIVNLTGKEQKIILSIDLVKEDNRWQVTREVIFNSL
ncbi:hypothetical protein [Cellulophaga fucicola]|uniref:hypothetical protein n=1 Tax=Cellulophaga fucicola TaxID=76595 RepID=UPI003EBBB99B